MRLPVLPGFRSEAVASEALKRPLLHHEAQR